MPSIVICNSLISRARYWRRQRYLKKKYANKPPEIYYDERYHTYISPTNLNEDGETHAHDFANVLKNAYDYAEIFSIPEKYREKYSTQELEFLEKLIQRGLKDRQKNTFLKLDTRDQP